MTNPILETWIAGLTAYGVIVLPVVLIITMQTFEYHIQRALKQATI